MSEQTVIDGSVNVDVSKHKGGQFKQYDISEVNKKYLEAFQKGKYPEFDTDIKQRNSMLQYRCSINNILEFTKKDAATITEKDFLNWSKDIVNEKTKTNKLNHFKSFLNYILTKNIHFARQRTTVEALVFAGIVPEWFVKDKSILKKLNNSHID